VADDFGDAHVGYVLGADDAVLTCVGHLFAAEAEGGEMREAGAQFGDELGSVVVAAGFSGGEEEGRIGVGGDEVSLAVEGVGGEDRGVYPHVQN